MYMVRGINSCAADFVFLQSAMEMSENIQHNSAQELMAVANEYCWLMENISGFDADKVLEFMRKILPLLYVKGCAINVPEGADEGDMQRYVTEENYEIIFNDVRNKLKQFEKFHLYNPDLKETEEKSTAECLTDIYQDLKDGLIAYTKGLEAEKAAALLCLRLWFPERWGAHAANLLPSLHNIFEKKQSTEQTGTEFD